MAPTDQDPASDDYIDIDDTGPEGLQGAAGGYTWEEEYKRSWDTIQEDESGSLQSAVQGIKDQLLRRRRMRDTTAVQRGIIRHVVAVVDGSESMGTRDMRPTRIGAAVQALEAFVGEFFDQNPVSQLALVATKDGLAEQLAGLSGSAQDLVRALHAKGVRDLAGEPSLQNALELALHALRATPAHGTREVVCIVGSLTTRDPGDIMQTLAALKRERVRVSIVELSAEVRVFKRICDETRGVFAVAEDETRLRELLLDRVPPPPAVDGRSALVCMGFPVRASAAVPGFCACHRRLSYAGFVCPRCAARLCSLPTDCDVCALPLVSAPHLARSYHHLFPEENFREVPSADAAAARVCFGCHAAAAAGSTRYACPKCSREFCIDCDVFIHETLHNCPGCV